MPHGFILNITSHKYLLVGGIALIAATLFWGQGHLQTFDHRLSEVVEESLVASAELRSMEQRASYLEMAAKAAMAEAQQKNPELIDEVALVESSYELQKLRQEADLIRLQNQEATQRYDAVVAKKKRLLGRFQFSYWGSLLGLLVGTILATTGMVFWYFRIKLVKDRRDAPRADDV